MKSHSEYGDMYDRLMAISQEALESAHYETAYHALAAAMHYAQTVGDSQRLLDVEHTAKAQRDLIDACAPTHRMSTQSAAQRSGINMYNMLARQAATQALMVQQAQHFKHLKS